MCSLAATTAAAATVARINCVFIEPTENKHKQSSILLQSPLDFYLVMNKQIVFCILAQLVGVATSQSAAGSPNCRNVQCPSHLCPRGRRSYTPPGRCCPLSVEARSRPRNCTVVLSDPCLSTLDLALGNLPSDPVLGLSTTVAPADSSFRHQLVAAHGVRIVDLWGSSVDSLSS